jgi:glucose-6-phosphate 1-epimerase
MSSNIHSETGPGNLRTVTIRNPYGSATVSLLGATLIDWTPADQRPVIWLSEKAVFKPGKGIRGGIPICWPWFGAHPGNPDFPQHGIARTRLWELKAGEELADGRSRAVFTLQPEPDSIWPFHSRLEFIVTLGECLELELVTHNLGNTEFEISQALHTYFNIGDIYQVGVSGLDGKRYLDKLEGFAERTQQGDIEFSTEVDRVYLGSEDTCTIDDRAMNRQIEISKQGSRSTVVWNPWRDNSIKMADMSDEGYRTMVCVETTNAATDTRRIEPGTQHAVQVSYRVKS